MQYKQILKPTVLFAAGSMASVAHGAVIPVDISARPEGNQIAIGVPLSDAQFSFGYGPSIVGGIKYELSANGTPGVYRQYTDGTLPGPSTPFESSMKTGGLLDTGDVIDNSGYYGLRFDVGSTTHYGVALVDQGGTHISELNLDDALSVSSSAPEPTTWAEMVLGLGLAGAAMRRRQSALASA